jgi:hypothetical protein
MTLAVDEALALREQTPKVCCFAAKKHHPLIDLRNPTCAATLLEQKGALIMSSASNDTADSDLAAARTTPDPSRTTPAHVVADPDIFAENFDKRPFYVKHDLAHHPLLRLSAIAALSERLPKNLLEWHLGQVEAFTNPGTLKSHNLSCSDAILKVAEQATWVLLLQIEHDRLYKQLLDELLDQIELLSKRTHPGMSERQAFLFVSSRAAVTPFHFDPEYNFLLQVRGQKTICMWDPSNRIVLPARALDNYYAGIGGGDPLYANRNQPYRDEFMASAWQVPITAGQGVHFPLHAPHMVSTESDVSISLSITFRTRRSQFNAVVHGANGHVRRVGIEPPAPGTSHLWDMAANVAFRGLRKGVALTKRIVAGAH